jgi:hypothetical protein
MSEFRKTLLRKHLQSDYLNDFEHKKFMEYINKVNIMTYMMHEDNLDSLDQEYVAWCKLKIQRTNYELSKDKNLMKFLSK